MVFGIFKFSFQMHGCQQKSLSWIEAMESIPLQWSTNSSGCHTHSTVFCCHNKFLAKYTRVLLNNPSNISLQFGWHLSRMAAFGSSFNSVGHLELRYIGLYGRFGHFFQCFCFSIVVSRHHLINKSLFQIRRQVIIGRHDEMK